MTVENETLLPLIAEVGQLVVPQAETLAARRDEPDYHDLWSETDVAIAGREKKEVFFADLVIQKSDVSFSFMPVYASGDLRAVFGPELPATLKSRSCFLIRRLTPEPAQQIEAALRAGRELCEDRCSA